MDRNTIPWFRYFRLRPVYIGAVGEADGLKYYKNRAQAEPWGVVRAAVTVSGLIAATALGLAAWRQVPLSISKRSKKSLAICSFGIGSQARIANLLPQTIRLQPKPPPIWRRQNSEKMKEIFKTLHFESA